MLVHGAFADASSWNGVIELLQGEGVKVTEFAIDPAKFRDAFAVDLPAKQTAVMAATQRPVAEATFPSRLLHPPGSN